MKAVTKMLLAGFVLSFILAGVLADPTPTTIKLQDNVTDNLADSWVVVYGSFSNFNWGTVDYIRLSNNQTKPYRIYLMFNISSVPVDQVISNAKLCLQTWSCAGTSAFQVSTHHVYDHTWDGENEMTITGDNQVCGIEFDDSTDCNTTASDVHIIKNSETAWHCWDITQAVKAEYTSSDYNVSVALKTFENDTQIIGSEADLFSKEYLADPTYRPYLNITYYANSVPTVSGLVEPTDPSTYDNSDTYTFNATICDDDLVADIDTVIFSWAGTNTTITTKINTNTTCEDYYTTKSNQGVQLATAYAWYANDSVGAVDGASGTFTINKVTGVINVRSINDTYTNFNQSVMLVVNASSIGEVKATLQTSAGSSNVTLAWNTSLYYYEITNADLGYQSANATRVNTTSFYLDGGNFTLIQNISTLFFDYGRTQLTDISNTPSETSNSLSAYETFYANYTTTEPSDILGTCVVEVRNRNYTMIYDGGLHSVSVSTNSWSVGTYDYTIRCTNSSYQPQIQINVGSFTVIKGTGVGGASSGGISMGTLSASPASLYFRLSKDRPCESKEITFLWNGGMVIDAEILIEPSETIGLFRRPEHGEMFSMMASEEIPVEVCIPSGLSQTVVSDVMKSVESNITIKFAVKSLPDIRFEVGVPVKVEIIGEASVSFVPARNVVLYVVVVAVGFILFWKVFFEKY